MTKFGKFLACTTLVVSALTAPAFAAPIASECTPTSGTTNLGSLGPPGAATFGNCFNGAGTFNDLYGFSLNAPANSLGWTIELDPWGGLGIDLTGISLSGGTLSGTLSDSSLGTWINSFSFGGLGAGNYLLSIGGAVTAATSRTMWGSNEVGYIGLITTRATPVPEPAALGLLGLGLIGIGLARRRRAA